LTTAPIDTHKHLPTSTAKSETSDTDATEEDDDLDAPPKSQSQKSSQPIRKPSFRAESSSPEKLPPPKADISPAAKPKPKGFRIGGRAKKASEESPPSHSKVQDVLPDTRGSPAQEPPLPQDTADDPAPKKARRNFKIGGKGKETAGGGEGSLEPVPSMADRTRAIHSPSVQPPSSPPARYDKDETPVVEEKHEETPEEKAERRRAELKRKTEEAAKKQAQSKKKRRF
jgi:hypothetical protein